MLSYSASQLIDLATVVKASEAMQCETDKEKLNYQERYTFFC